MDKAKLEKIRAEVKALKAGSSRPRYTEEIRAAARDLFREGLEPKEVCNEIGVGAGTLAAWSRGLTERQFRKVKVEKKTAPDFRFTIAFPSGAMLEASSLEILKQLLVMLK